MRDCIVVNFDNNYHSKNPNKKKAEEFPKQLQNQENGLNDLTVAEILLNRHEYFKRKNEASDRGVKQPSGRSSEGARAQKKANQTAKNIIQRKRYKDLVKKFQEKNNRKPSRDEKEKLIESAENYAKDQMKGKAALHNPDQFAGGYGTNIGGIGDRGVNSAIGSQWEKKNRANGMEDELWDYINKNDVKPDECIYLFANIKLKEN